jgi:hypothetical protein
MKLVPLNTIFHVEYGNQFDFSKMTLSDDDEGINFVARSSKNFGIVGRVDKKIIEPYEAGLITVCLGGSILESFIQPAKFYTAQNIKVLKPLGELSFNEKLFYCICIKENRFRYSTFGREANVSLNSLLVPSQMPRHFEKIALSNIIEDFKKPVLTPERKLKHIRWHEFRLDELFNLKKGTRILNRDMIPGETPCIRATGQNNGITAYIAHPPNHAGNTITVSYNGSIGEAFYQERPHFALDDVNVLYPKPLFKLNKYTAIFTCTLIRKERFRFNYGRKWHLERMSETKIKLPIMENGRPDFEFIENYIKSLLYSGSI